MRKYFAVAALALSTLGAAMVSAPAQATEQAGITCKTTVTRQGSNIKATITSNKPIVYGQTSFVFRYTNADKRVKSLTYDEGYGTSKTVARLSGMREWVDVRTWHAGKACTRYVFNGGFSLVSNTGKADFPYFTCSVLPPTDLGGNRYRLAISSTYPVRQGGVHAYEFVTRQLTIKGWRFRTFKYSNVSNVLVVKVVGKPYSLDGRQAQAYDQLPHEGQICYNWHK